ncbi:MAG: ABC transporter permease [Lachnospiraceae bacterium]|nr:ABC transporter permease [Lachnospiraceae bacterium]
MSDRLHTIKKGRKKLPGAVRVLLLSGVLTALLGWICLGAASRLADSFPDLQEADRWDRSGQSAQIAAYFSVDAQMEAMQLRSLDKRINAALEEAGLIPEEGSEARQFAYTFSATGQITLTHGKKTATVDAIGTEGDFFYFHPVELRSGYYYGGDEVNKDGILLDEITAWQLYGSNDIEGQVLLVGEIPLIVRGVYRQPEGRLAKAAGLGKPKVFVSYDVLDELGMSYGLNHFEIVMPDPIRNFAVTKIKELLGTDEMNAEIIDCTKRFGIVNRLQLIRSFGTRSMNGKAIIYPYWENIARGLEDEVAAWTLAALVLLGYTLLLYVTLIVIWWRTKGWSFWDVFRKFFKETIPDAFLALKKHLRRKRAKGKTPEGEAPEGETPEGGQTDGENPKKGRIRKEKPKREKTKKEKPKKEKRGKTKAETTEGSTGPTEGSEGESEGGEHEKE